MRQTSLLDLKRAVNGIYGGQQEIDASREVELLERRARMYGASTKEIEEITHPKRIHRSRSFTTREP